MYCFEISYKTKWDQGITTPSDKSIESPRYITLDRNLEFERFYLNITHQLNDLKLTVHYYGDGEFSINYINLYRSSLEYVKQALIIIAVTTALELCFVFASKDENSFLLLMALIGIIIFSFIPCTLFGFVEGHDHIFHLTRIQGLAQELQNGRFPIYIQSIWGSGYGSPVSMYYGDYLLYIPAVLFTLGFSLTTSYKVYILIVSTLTAFISYYSFNYVFKKRSTALVLTLVWTCLPYRLVDIYIRSAVGEYTALIALPLVFASYYGIIYGQDMKKNSVLLALGMSIIICTHILSVIMTVLILVLVSIVSIKQLFKADRIKYILKAVIMCILFSAIFIVPFIDSYLSNDLAINHPNAFNGIQGTGVQFGEFFLFFGNVFGQGGNPIKYMEFFDRFYMTIGALLTISLFASVYLIYKKKGTKNLKYYTLFTMVLLFMSSNLFPWDSIEKLKSLKFLTSIQFPWRYLAYASLFAVAMLGEEINLIELNKDKIKETYCISTRVIKIVLCALCLFETSYIYSEYSKQDRTYIFTLYENGVTDSLYEYTPYDADERTHEIKTNGNVDIYYYSQNGSTYYLECKTYDSVGEISIPLYNYKGYVAKDKDGNNIEIKTGNQGEITFEVPENYSGSITISFEPLWYWTAAKVISLVFIIYLFIRYVVIEKINRKKLTHSVG